MFKFLFKVFSAWLRDEMVFSCWDTLWLNDLIEDDIPLSVSSDDAWLDFIALSFCVISLNWSLVVDFKRVI